MQLVLQVLDKLYSAAAAETLCCHQVKKKAEVTAGSPQVADRKEKVPFLAPPVEKNLL